MSDGHGRRGSTSDSSRQLPGCLPRDCQRDIQSSSNSRARTSLRIHRNSGVTLLINIRSRFHFTVKLEKISRGTGVLVLRMRKMSETVRPGVTGNRLGSWVRPSSTVTSCGASSMFARRSFLALSCPSRNPRLLTRYRICVPEHCLINSAVDRFLALT